MANLLMLTGNPISRRKSGKRKGKLSRIMRRAKSLRKEGLSASAALKEAWRGNPHGGRKMAKRRKRRAGSKRRRNPVAAGLALNPARRRHRRAARSHKRGTRRNPAMALGQGLGLIGPGQILMPVVWIAAGSVAGAAAQNAVGRFLPITESNAAVKAVKDVAVALVLGAVARKATGKKEVGVLVAAGALTPMVLALVGRVLPASSVKLLGADEEAGEGETLRLGAGYATPLGSGYAPEMGY